MALTFVGLEALPLGGERDHRVIEDGLEEFQFFGRHGRGFEILPRVTDGFLEERDRSAEAEGLAGLGHLVLAVGDRAAVGVAEFQSRVAFAVFLDVRQADVFDEGVLLVQYARLIDGPGAVGVFLIQLATLARGQDDVIRAVRLGQCLDLAVAHALQRLAAHQFLGALGVVDNPPNRGEFVPPVLGVFGAEVKLRAIAPFANDRSVGIHPEAARLGGREEERFARGGLGGPELDADPGILSIHSRQGLRPLAVHAEQDGHIEDGDRAAGQRARAKACPEDHPDDGGNAQGDPERLARVG